LANKSAQKAVRASGRKQKRNQTARSKVKTDIARAEQLIAAGDLEAAQVRRFCTLIMQRDVNHVC
jgi:ribosomal protein S20